MKKFWIFSLALASMAGIARADVTMPRIFARFMVLQADMPDPVWGTAAPDETVTVEINGQKKEATAGKDGKWMVKLDPQKQGGPFELKVTGKNSLSFKDVLVGEVWHASGQSNMRYSFANADTFAADAPKADYPKIRYFQMDPYHPDSGQWVVCTPNSVGRFSAVAYYFAKDLHEHMLVPVGIIDTSVSGAQIRTFFSPAAIEADPALASAIKSQKGGQDVSSNFTPMITQIIPYGIRGVIWYQGEGDRDISTTYQTLFPDLITDWRKLWDQGNFPFLFVQLSNFRERKPQPFVSGDVGLREAQAKTLSVPNTAMAVTIDLAAPNRLPTKTDPNPAVPPGNFDVQNVHYPNKKPVGARLALAARALAYGEKIEYSGPMFDSVKFDGGKATVSFTHVGAGLEAKGGVLKGFLISGADKKWVRANAVIDGDKVVVSSDAVKEPVAVRYAYEENPEVTFYNKDGLPGVPFRSDTWDQFGLRNE